MTASDLPESIRPDRMAGAEATLQGAIPLSCFGRLCECLLDADGTVQVDLRFSVDERRQVQVDGSLDSQVNMTCQRCLQPAGIALSAPVTLTLVAGEELVERVPEQRDALVLDASAPVTLVSLLEDELMLALPVVAMHQDESCHAPEVSGEAEAVEAAEPAPRKSFAALEALKSDLQQRSGSKKDEPSGDA